jgi:Fe-S-cluster containining protein
MNKGTNSVDKEDKSSNPEENKNKSSNETESQEKEIKPKGKKFKFECTRCGECCQNREPIPVTFDDLSRWTTEGSLMSIILPHLELRSISEQDEISKIAIVPFIKMKDTNDDGLGTCPFYDDENKMCNIYFSMPINCKTFPLSYNGEKYYISDPSCPGIGKGTMTKEKLEEMRDNAVKDFTQRSETALAMIPLQGMFIRYFMKQSQEQVERLSDDEKAKLDELIQKSQSENATSPSTGDKASK